MSYEFKGTPGPWYPINFSGYWELLNEDYYEAENVLDNDFGRADLNAKLASKAPEMFEMLKNYLSDLKNIMPQSPASNNRIQSVEKLLEEIIEDMKQAIKVLSKYIDPTSIDEYDRVLDSIF